MVEERKNGIVGVMKQGAMFLLLGIEQVRTGEAFSAMFTFEDNGWKRFIALSLGHPNTSPRD